VALRSRFEEIRRAEIAKTVSTWKELTPEGEKRLEALTGAILNKLLHTPTNVLKQANQGNRADLYLDALRSLFDLSPECTEEKGEEDTDELEE
jgi:glutamyl-tRNA reductase